MNSHTVAEFWKLFYQLPRDVQRAAYRAYASLSETPFSVG